MSSNATPAKLVVHNEDKAGLGFDSIDFSFNPEAVRVTKSVKPKAQEQAGQDAAELQFTTGGSAKIEFGEIIFDTFDLRASVYSAHITKLEKLIHVNEHKHRPVRVMFMWGQGFGSENGRINTGHFFVTGLDVNYIMFLPTGIPVRAKVKLTLTEVPQEATKKKSPDTAHVHLVGRGDSLQSIAWSEYEDPSEWRRIAEANGIDDPLSLVPGRRLLIPPILK